MPGVCPVNSGDSGRSARRVGTDGHECTFTAQTLLSTERDTGKARMLRYFFHCTDGADLILDRHGRTLASDDHALGHGLFVAEKIMRELSDYEEWSSWTVCVYDIDQRMIGTVPFDRALPALANGPAIDGAMSWPTCFRLPNPHRSTKSL